MREREGMEDRDRVRERGKEGKIEEKLVTLLVTVTNRPVTTEVFEKKSAGKMMTH